MLALLAVAFALLGLAALVGTRTPWKVERTGYVPAPVVLAAALSIFLGASAFLVIGLGDFGYFGGGYRKSPALFLLFVPLVMVVGAVGTWRALKQIRD